MTSKVHWKFLISLALCLTISKAAFVSHNYELARQPSNGTNVASIDILDDAAFDIRYSTKCNSCKCFLEMPILTTYESQLESSFTGELIQNFITKGRLYLLHRSAQSAISYSIFDVKLPSTLTKIAKQVAIPSFTGINNIVFSPGSPAFVGYSAESGSLVINKIDGEGHIKENSYSFTNNNGEIYDMAYAEDLVFFARGERGLEVITVKNSNLESALLSLEDLEVKEGFEVKTLEIDYDNKILYVFDPNSEQGTVVTLDYSNKDEVSLINNYELGIKQITQLVALNNKLIVVNKEEDEKYNYFEYLRVPSDKYDKPEMIKFWHFSQKINSIQRSDNDILIDADDYLYIFRKDLPYETETSQLIIDLIRKEEAGDYFLITKDNDKFLLKVSSSKFALDSIQQRPSISLKCGIYKEGGKYALDIPFTVDIYRDSCSDAPTKSADNVCLDRYTFDVSFTGNKFLEFDANTYAISPNPVHLSNWNEIPVQNNGTVVSHGSHGNQTEGPEDDGGLVTPIKKPDLIEPDAPYNDRINNVYLLVIVGVIVLTCFGCVIKCLIDFVRTSKARLSDQYKHQQLEEEEPGSDEDEQDTGPQNASEVRKAVSPTDEESEEQY